MVPGCVPISLVSFSWDSQGTMHAVTPVGLGHPAGYLGEVWDLIRPDLPPLNWGHSSIFVLWSFPIAPFGLQGPPEALFGLSHPGCVGSAGSSNSIHLYRGILDSLQSFIQENQGTLPAEAPLALWPPAVLLGEVWDLNWPDPSLPTWGAFFKFWIYKVFPELHRLGCTNLQKHSLACLGAAGWSICINLLRGGCGPSCQISALGVNGVVAYSIWAYTHTHNLPWMSEKSWLLTVGSNLIFFLHKASKTILES